MANTNSIKSVIEQVHESGGEIAYGSYDEFYLSANGVDTLMTDTAQILTADEALALIAQGKVWGMNVAAKELLIAHLATQEAVQAAFEENSTPTAETEDKPVEALEAPKTESDTQGAGIEEIPVALNWRNLVNLVSDGSIFYVEFIKRTTGELRKMKCRAGVKKYLRGGAKGYSAKAKNLLTVFDMENKGYRSIPVEAIKALSINGQQFNFAGV